MKKVVYVGAFPPPYGGVTVKNNNLYTALSEHFDIQKIDLSAIKQKDLRTAVRLIQVLLGRENTFIIGVAGKETRKRFCKLLYFCNRVAMRRSIIFLMGGTSSKDIAADPEYQKYAAIFKQLYVETNGMRRELAAVGLKNVGLYPNCRFRPDLPLNAEIDSEEPSENQQLKRVEIKDPAPLRCLFFSQVSVEKGIDLVLGAAKCLQRVQYDVYGVIHPDAGMIINSFDQLSNISYRGVYKVKGDNVYTLLKQYDVLLLPTRWKAEGVPGVLVEAKIAGIPAIVSDVCYNAEVVEDGVSWIVLKENTVEELINAIRTLDADRATLAKLAAGAKQSAERYYIENYIPAICADILDVGTEDGGVSYEIICILFLLLAFGSWQRASGAKMDMAVFASPLSGEKER